MSKKIPFLEMFAALRRVADLAAAVEGWLIVSAAIDRAGRSAVIAVEGAAGAGRELLARLEQTLAGLYQLNTVMLDQPEMSVMREAQAAEKGGSGCGGIGAEPSAEHAGKDGSNCC